METSDNYSKVKVDSGWASQEFRDLSLGDARVERRLVKVAEDLAQQPTSPINQASRDNAAVKAAYRLFQNERVLPENIIKAHRNQTLARMKGEEVVLANQDTSYLNYSKHKATTGLGPIGDKRSNPQGLVMHSTFAVTPKGLPLGVLTLKIYARDGHLDPKQSEKRAIEEKESYRWIETLPQVKGIPNLVMQGDRENDIYESLVEAEKLNVKYNLRSCTDRKIDSEEQAIFQAFLHTFLMNSPARGEIEIELPEEKRKARMEIKYERVEILPPKRITRSKKAKGVLCWIVQISEIDVPAGNQAVCWNLLTNVPVETNDDAIERIAWYTLYR